MKTAFLAALAAFSARGGALRLQWIGLDDDGPVPAIADLLM